MTTQPKLTRRQFLTTLAAAAAGALVAGVVKVEPEPVEDVDVVPVREADLGMAYMVLDGTELTVYHPWAEPAKDDFDDMAWTEPATAWYLTVDGTQATPGPGVRTVMDWDAREDVRGIDLKLAVIMRPGLTTYYYNDGTGWRWRFKREMALYPTYSTDDVPITFEPWEPEPWEPDTQ